MPKILLVEDESSIADNVRLALRQEGLAVTHEKTARDGFRSATTETFSLVILDVGLPDESGFDLCKKIRKTSQVPILFLTARSDEVDKIVGFELGADDYLTKPFSTRELSARVKAILKRARPDSNSKVSDHGIFKVDHEKFKITVDGTALELSRYEFRILETLIRRPGVVFSRAQLMEIAWQDPGMSLERTVET
ncbi:MAG: response regulator, partial [Bdellovibrionota bacterium]